MSVVTLKDLMHPLSRIANATEQTLAKLDSVVSFVAGAGNTSTITLDVVNAELIKQTKLLQVIAKGKKVVDSDKSSDKKASFDKGGIEALGTLGSSLPNLVKGLVLIRVVRKKDVRNFISVIRELSSVFVPERGKPNKFKNLESGAESVSKLIESAAKLPESLIGITKNIIPIKIGVSIFKDTIKSLLSVFENYEVDENTEAGAKNLSLLVKSAGDVVQNLAKNILWLNLAPKATTLLYKVILNLAEIKKPLTTVSKIKHEDLADIGISINRFIKSIAGAAFFAAVAIPFIGAINGVISGLTTSIIAIGTREKEIKKGRKSLVGLTTGLILFAGGLLGALLLASFFITNPIQVLGLAFALTVIGGAVWLLGKLNNSGFIYKGSLALAAMGGALAVFGIGYGLFANSTKQITLADAGVQLAVLVGITAVMAGLAALVTFSAGLAFLGPLFMGAMGLSLIPLGIGLKAIKSANWTQRDGETLANTIAGIKIAVLGGEGKDSSFLGKIGRAVGSVVDNSALLAGAVSLGAMGVGLLSLSLGLAAFSKISWTQENTTVLVTALSGIVTAFGVAGGAGENPGGIWGMLFGSRFSPNATEKGISSVRNAGKALIGIAEGLTAFQDLVKQKIDFAVLGGDVAKVIGFVQSAFSAIGEEGNVEAGGFWNSLFKIKKNKVAEGISSVMKAGKALTSIAEGLTAFQDLVKQKIDFVTLASDISQVIGFVQGAFSAIGGEGTTEAGGFWNSLFKIKKNKVAEGISSVKGAGAELTKIAESINSLKGIKDAPGTAKLITTLFTSVINVFTEFSKVDKGAISPIRAATNFLEKIDKVTSNGTLDKAANATVKIANAINSIDSNKASSFSDLFKYAGNLPKDNSHYEALLKAIEEIKNAIVQENQQNKGIMQNIQTSASAHPSADLTSLLNNINSALGKLNYTMSSLPASIQSIKIIVPE